MIEVELKFPVASLTDLRRKFVEIGACSLYRTVQRDEYFDDPLRGFAQLDYALRIRSVDNQHWLTFKGPNLDRVAKMRNEVELPLVDQVAAEKMKQVFLGIGFRSVATVIKTREALTMNRDGHEIQICLDQVDEVGEFVELEIIVANDAEAESAIRSLHSLANIVGLAGTIRTSYLALLLKIRSSN